MTLCHGIHSTQQLGGLTDGIVSSSAYDTLRPDRRCRGAWSPGRRRAF